MAQFKHVVEAAKASGAAEWLPRLVEKDLTDPATLLQHPSVVLETGMPPEVWRVFQDSLQQQDGATPQNAITDTDSGAVSHRGAAPIAPPRDLVAFLTAIHGPQKGRVASQLDACDISAVDTTNIQLWTRDRRATYHMIVVGSQFLTTTDELWATSRSHIQLDGSRNVVTWTLPTGPPETQATTVDVSLGCRCPIMGQRLCPYHNMVELLNLTDSKGDTDRPFAHMGAQNPADLLKNIAHMLESSRTSEQPVQTAPPSGCLRATGARFLRRLGLSPTLITQLARWDSDTILGALDCIQLSTDVIQQRTGDSPGDSDAEIEALKAGIQADILSLAHHCHQMIRETTALNQAWLATAEEKP